MWGVGSDILAVVYSLWEPETFLTNLKKTPEKQ